MGELSIKVKVANRTYPLTIDSSEEEGIRKASKMIEERIKVFEREYAVKDVQDLLAMCALQFANEALDYETKELVEDDGLTDRVRELNGLIAETLNK